MNWQGIVDQAASFMTTKGVSIGLIIILSLIVMKLSKNLSKRIIKVIQKEKGEEESIKRRDTLASLLNYILFISIISISAVMILGELGIEIGPLLAAAGIIGLAIGFGSQRLVEDIISGFFILMEDQIRVGDYVATAGQSGIVEKVNLKMTVLRDLSGNVHFIRNGKIDIVTNMTKDYSRYIFEIGVAYRENIDEVMEIMEAVDEDLRNDPNMGQMILEPLELMGLDRFADSALIIKARTKTKPFKQWKIAREFHRRLKIKFDQLGIEIPFPHLTLYAGQDKKGNAAPLNIDLRKRG
jgi:small conductance mechanosensitive channel